MNQAQLDKFRIRLEEMQDEILGESEGTVLGMQEESTLYPDPNDHPWKGWRGGGIGRYVREWNLRDLSDSFGEPKLYDSWGWYWDDAWE